MIRVFIVPLNRADERPPAVQRPGQAPFCRFRVHSFFVFITLRLPQALPDSQKGENILKNDEQTGRKRNISSEDHGHSSRRFTPPFAFRCDRGLHDFGQAFGRQPRGHDPF